MKIKTVISILITVFFFTESTLCFGQQQALWLPPIFDSGMVLQQEDSVIIWGKSDMDSNVDVKTDWNSKNYKTISPQDGRWSLKVATPSASFTPYKIIG